MIRVAWACAMFHVIAGDSSRAGGRLRVWLIGAVGCLGTLMPALAQGTDARMILGTNVACRASPDTAAPAVRASRLGDVVVATEIREHSDGSRWYQAGACWVHGALTTAFDRSNPEPALLALADHVLARPAPVPFEDLVAADNLLTQRYGAVLEESGVLQLRRLQIVEKAIAGPEPRTGP